MPQIHSWHELSEVLSMQEKAVASGEVLMAPQKPTVFLVDDDSLMREYLVLLLQTSGYAVEAFESANEFLRSLDPKRPGCLILDIKMPGMGGLELQEHLTNLKVQIPTIIVTGYGDIPQAMRAVRAGALDFLEKPFDNKSLLSRIQQAFDLDAMTRQKQIKRQGVLDLIALLTPRECEIMEKLTSGELNNKTLAAHLHISRKTLDLHRGRILKKMQCQSLVELTRKIQIVSEEK
jgi:two-component system, LuxR family, response regulator FixJ